MGGQPSRSSICALTIVAAAAALPIEPAFPQEAWVPVISTETRYFAWNSTRGFPPGLAIQPGSGWQAYTPLTFQLTGNVQENFKVEFIVRGGYVRAQQTTRAATGSISTATDTVAAATVTYLGIPGIQPFASLTVNLPTGTARLAGVATFARMDPDLVDLATYGEGRNLGPTIGVNIPLTQTVILSFGAGRTIRGEYNRETIPGFVAGDVRLEPGDVTTVNASLGAKSGPFSLQASGSYSRESVTSYNGLPSVQLGNRYLTSGSASYAWSETSTTSVVASWSYAEKNKTIAPPLIMTPELEAFNSNSNVYRARVEHAFVVGDWSFGPLASFLHRDRNAYSTTAFQFVPAKTRRSAGGNLRYFIGSSAVLYATVERAWIEEGARPVAIPGGSIPSLTSSGWMVVTGGTIRF
jgi:hypothetical protein